MGPVGGHERCAAGWAGLLHRYPAPEGDLGARARLPAVGALARAGTRRQWGVPSERTFRRLLKAVDAQSLKDVLVQWMGQQDLRPVEVLHLDGKVLKNAQPAPACAKAQDVEIEIPLELQKPKADKALTLVNFITGHQRLVEQVAVPKNTNEEAAVAADFPKMDLAGLGISADTAHTTKA